MWIPLVVLAVLSIGGGFVLGNNHLLEHWLYPSGLTLLDHEAVSGHPHGWVGQYLMLMGIGAGVAGIIYGAIVYAKGLPKKERDEAGWHWFRRSAGNQFGYDQTIMESGVEGGGVLANWLWKGFDVKIVDGIVNGLASVSGGLGTLFRTLQTGYARSYALLMLMGGAALVGYFVYAMTVLGGNH